jgi:hypothetical protein
MPLPDKFAYTQGTPVIWGTPGGSGVTHSLTLNNIGATKARMGQVVDLGVDWYREYDVTFIIETGTTPTAGRTVELYLASSYDGTTWPAGITGSDADYKNNEELEWLVQLKNPASVLVATNDGNVTQTQHPELWMPNGRYVVPVIRNDLGFATRNQATPANNTGRVILIPRILQVID